MLKTGYNNVITNEDITITMVIIVMMLSLKSKTDIASIGKAEILEPLFLSIEFFLHIDTLKQPCQNAKLKKL